jgi:hypothetical protein
MKKIIFLDIDGVLNVIGQGSDEFGQKFHKHFEDNLRWVVEETGAEIVISSSWRFIGLNKMREMWKKRNLPGNIIDVTPREIEVVERGTCRFYDDVSRGHEIQQWIDDNGVDCYCIIDDDNDMLLSQMDNFVRTSNNTDHPDCVDMMGYGLTRKCAERVIEILNKNNQPEIKRYCKGCLCDVTKTMFCYCGEFPLTKDSTYTDEDMKNLNI